MSYLNSTSVLNSLSTTIITPSNVPYNHQGAALYIAVILVWYSTGLAMMLFLQVRPRTPQQQYHFDANDSSRKQTRQSVASNPFAKYRMIQADNTTKQILNELKDPVRRQRLWKIYYSSSEKNNDTYPQYYQTITSDGATIDRIKRKLADIHRVDALKDDGMTSSMAISGTNEPQRINTTTDASKFFSKRFPNLRRPTIQTPGNGRPNLFRNYSQTDTTSAPMNIEMESLIGRKPSPVSTNNRSERRTDVCTKHFDVAAISAVEENPNDLESDAKE